MATQIQTPRKSSADHPAADFRVEDVVKSIFIDIVAVGTLFGGTCWVYWSDLLTIQNRWQSDPHYSHGYLVPLFALILLAVRRAEFRPLRWSPSWWGFLLLAGGLGLKILSSYYYIESLSHVSLIVVLSSIPAVVWGAKGFKWALPGVVFLIFMLPLPFRLEGAMQAPLRSIGTKAGTYFLQTIGIPAFNEGYVIVVWQDSIASFESIGVAEACSGLNMLMVFFALSSAIALVMTESWPFRFILVASAVPIAVATNILRIAVTAAVYVYFSQTTLFGMPGSEFAHKFFHDWAGWFMMPIGFFMLWLEIWILERLFVRVPDRPVSILQTHSAVGAHHSRS